MPPLGQSDAMSEASMDLDVFDGRDDAEPVKKWKEAPMSEVRRIPQPRVEELQASAYAILEEVTQREEERLGLEPGLEAVFYVTEIDIPVTGVANTA
jgi:hypothetical protein